MDITDWHATRFWQKVDKSGECWIWTAHTHHGGYGTLKINNRSYRAHRVAYILTYGSIPVDKIICHRCNNRSCVNPEHLYAGTYSDNARDRVLSGNQKSPLGKAKLNEQQIQEMREKCKHTIFRKHIAHEYGITPATLNKILRRFS